MSKYLCPSWGGLRQNFLYFSWLKTPHSPVTTVDQTLSSTLLWCYSPWIIACNKHLHYICGQSPKAGPLISLRPDKIHTCYIDVVRSNLFAFSFPVTNCGEGSLGCVRRGPQDGLIQPCTSNHSCKSLPEQVWDSIILHGLGPGSGLRSGLREWKVRWCMSIGGAHPKVWATLV